MRLALASTAYSDLPLADAADRLAALGLDAIELAVDTRARLCDVDALLDAGERRAIQRLLAERGLDVVALANHDDGQLVLGPHHAVTDGFYLGTPEEKRAYGIRRMKDTARAADALGVRLVAGFTGCPDYARWFHWHDEPGWEANYEALAVDWSQILDVYREYGVRFAHELHPKQVVYEPVGARMSLELFAGYDEWGFSLDTANLMLAGVDPVAFAREFAARIFYVHAKDAEVVEPTTREHFIARPGYGELGRNFRFRVPGWGQVPWTKVITELHTGGYDGVVAVETEDATLGRWEGCRRGLDHIRPLLPTEPPAPRWW